MEFLTRVGAIAGMDPGWGGEGGGFGG